VRSVEKKSRAGVVDSVFCSFSDSMFPSKGVSKSSPKRF